MPIPLRTATVVVPRKHGVTNYQLTILESEGVWEFVSDVRRRLLTGLNPDGFRIGLRMNASHTAELVCSALLYCWR